MAAINKSKNIATQNSNISISGIIQKITSWARGNSNNQKANASASAYSDEDYIRDKAQQEAKKIIEKAQKNVYSYWGI